MKIAANFFGLRKDKTMMKFIYHLTMFRSRSMIIKKYSVEFWKNFKSASDKLFLDVLERTPDIGESVFSFNYTYAPSYVAWYRTMRKLGLDAAKTDELMWRMNKSERLIQISVDRAAGEGCFLT